LASDLDDVGKTLPAYVLLEDGILAGILAYTITNLGQLASGNKRVFMNPFFAATNGSAKGRQTNQKLK